MWIHSQLEICWRSLLLLYLLAVARVFVCCTPLVKGEHGGNSTIRDGRRLLKGAPLVLALFWQLPACAAMSPAHRPTTQDGSGFLLPTSSDGCERHAQIEVMPPVATATVASDASARSCVQEASVPLCLHAASALSNAEAVRAVAVMHRFQRSPIFASEWIDPGDPVGLVVQNFSDAFFGSEPEDLLLPAIPQPSNHLVTFVSVPSWTVDMLLTPILFRVLTCQDEVYFVDLLPGRITSDDVRHSAGRHWPLAGRNFVGDSLGPLAEDALVHVRPGTLVSICGRGRGCPLTHPLAHKLQEPSLWFRDFESQGFPPEPEPRASVGLVGAMCDCDVIEIEANVTSRLFRSQVAHLLGFQAEGVRFSSPKGHVWDLAFRGSVVRELAGLVPCSLDGCFAVFVDARSLATAVQLVFLPPFRTTVDALLQLIRAHRPLHRRLSIAGVSSFCNVTEAFMPEPDSVITISVVPRWREDIPDPFVFPPNCRPTSGPSSGDGNPPVGASCAPAARSGATPSDYVQGPAPDLATSLPPAPSWGTCPLPDVEPLAPAKAPAHLSSLTLPAGAMQASPVPIQAAASQPIATLQPALTSLPYVVSLEERDLQLRQPSELSRDVVERELADLPGNAFRQVDYNSQDLIPNPHEQVESSLPKEDPSAEFGPTEWSLGVRILAFQKRPSFATVWVAEGENVMSWLERATILLSDPHGFFELMVPDVQIGDGMITALLTPKWWRSVGKHAVLVSRANDGREAHVAVASRGMTVEGLLPLSGQLTSEMIDAFLDEDGPSNMGESWHPAPAASIIFQQVGLTEPELPWLAQVLGDIRFEMRNADLPVEPLPPLLRWLLLGPGSEQIILDVDGEPLSSQVSAMTGLPAASLQLESQRGCFDNLAIAGVAVSKCISYRDRRMPTPPHSITLFIDGRLLGVPVCSIVVGKDSFTAVGLARLVDAEVPVHLEVQAAGGVPHEGDPRTFSFCSGDTVVLSATLPAADGRRQTSPPGGSATSGGSPHPPPPATNEDSEAARSRSPRRSPLTSDGGDGSFSAAPGNARALENCIDGTSSSWAFLPQSACLTVSAGSDDPVLLPAAPSTAITFTVSEELNPMQLPSTRECSLGLWSPPPSVPCKRQPLPLSSARAALQSSPAARCLPTPCRNVAAAALSLNLPGPERAPALENEDGLSARIVLSSASIESTDVHDSDMWLPVIFDDACDACLHAATPVEERKFSPLDFSPWLHIVTPQSFPLYSSSPPRRHATRIWLVFSVSFCLLLKKVAELLSTMQLILMCWTHVRKLQPWSV